MLYVANIDENDINTYQSNKHYQALKNLVGEENIIALSVKIEYEISQLDEQSKEEFIKELNLSSSGLDKLIFSSYKLLNLSTFFTYGKKEVRA